MNAIERGAEIALPILGLLALAILWLSSAYSVLTKHGRRTCFNPMLSLAIFGAPIFAGLCWLVGVMAGAK